MEYREPLPVGTRVKLLRSIYPVKAGMEGVVVELVSDAFFDLAPGTVVVQWNTGNPDDWSVLYGPDAVRQFEENRVWILL